MCGRFVSADDAEILQAQWELAVISDAARQVAPSWNIPPTASIRLIVNTDEQLELHAGRWGLLPRWVKDPSSFPTLFNARSETIDTTRSFAPLITTSRCLIPANGYYEWQKRATGKSQPVYIHPHHLGHDPAGADEAETASPTSPSQPADFAEPVAFAGLYSWWKETPHNSPWQLTCTIITRDARPELAPIHHREAILLNQDQGKKWLHPGLGDSGSQASPDAIKDFLASAAVPLDYYPVNPQVGSVGQNGPSLITPQ